MKKILLSLFSFVTLVSAELYEGKGIELGGFNLDRSYQWNCNQLKEKFTKEYKEENHSDYHESCNSKFVSISRKTLTDDVKRIKINPKYFGLLDITGIDLAQKLIDSKSWLPTLNKIVYEDGSVSYKYHSSKLEFSITVNQYFIWLWKEKKLILKKSYEM